MRDAFVPFSLLGPQDLAYAGPPNSAKSLNNSNFCNIDPISIFVDSIDWEWCLLFDLKFLCYQIVRYLGCGVLYWTEFGVFLLVVSRWVMSRWVVSRWVVSRYRISVRIARAACFFPSNANSIFRSIMNNLTHRINWLDIFNLCQIAINLFVKT